MLKTILLLFLICSFSSCNESPQSRIKGKVDSTSIESIATPKFIEPASYSIWDSISSKFPLNTEQIKKLGFSELYMTGEEESWGESYYSISDSLRVVILSFNDKRVCIKKLLVTVNSRSETGIEYKVISTDCDIDASTENVRTNFQHINDTTFAIEERLYAKGDEDMENPQITKRKFRIKENGEILELKF
ncbi:hypothetical protein DVR12_17720 [Chitinophaga silvatica]|uniref:Lipoprotein n=1 Tax=Chitinophaga silvatica TaxID=2282649 RepID=A0A3E1Y7Z5_9BACT|nr:hypothetical protein [Chitinophaga silvatica]RFS21172.1 hypothetical protein DVR12_17720 [Chitinophaga silvatica]